MSWDAASFEHGAPWHMTPDGVWHEGPSSAPRVVTGHVVKVDQWGVTIAEGGRLARLGRSGRAEMEGLMTPYHTDATDEHRQIEAEVERARRRARSIAEEIERARAWEVLKDHAILWVCDRAVEVLTGLQRWVRRVTS